MSDIAVKLDAGLPWGSGSNQRWFDSLSVRWLMVGGSVPDQNSVFVLSLIHTYPISDPEPLQRFFFSVFHRV